MNKTEHKKKAIIEALEKTLGVVTTACKKAGIGRTQYYNWLKEDHEFAEKVEELENVALDFAETKLYEQIDNNNITAIIFYLKTKGRKRGYVEKIDIGGGLSVGVDPKEITFGLIQEDGTVTTT